MADEKIFRCAKCDFEGKETDLKDGKCPKCGEPVAEKAIEVVIAKDVKCTKCDFEGKESELKDGKCLKCGGDVVEKGAAQATDEHTDQQTQLTSEEAFATAKVELEKAIAELGKELTEEEVLALIDEAKKGKKEEEYYYYYKDKDGDYKKVEPQYPYYYYKDGDKYYPYYPYYYYYYDKKLGEVLKSLVDVIANLKERLDKVENAEKDIDTFIGELFKE